MKTEEFNAFCVKVDPGHKVTTDGVNLFFHNSSGNQFQVLINDVGAVLKIWTERNAEITDYIRNHVENSDNNPWHYQEKPYRGVFSQFFVDERFNAIRQQARSQTRSLMSAISKYVGFTIGNNACNYADPLLLDAGSLAAFTALMQNSGVHEKTSEYYPGLKEAFAAICAFCAIYNKHEGPLLVSDPEVKRALEPLALIRGWAERHFATFRGVSMQVKSARGAGWYPRVPWLCILPPGQTVNNGIYLALCFGKEGAGALVGCAQSVTNPKGLNVVYRTKKAPSLAIDVDGTTRNTRYNNSFENPREIYLHEFDEHMLREYIGESLDLCLKHLGLASALHAPTVAVEKHYSSIVPAFHDALQKAGYVYSAAQVRSFVCSLATKPFLLLAGNAGTGKTKLALLFAEWLSPSVSGTSVLVPVGADWTDNRNILGFLNLLRRDDEGAPVYQSTDALDLFLLAKESGGRPFFLLLDEMNLSHAERYFADILSAMESGRPVPLYREDEEVEVRTSSGIRLDNGSLKLPSNVFIVGTVNVDETTYMFSSKVLDRANVVEMRLKSTAATEYLASKGGHRTAIGNAPAGTAETFLELSRRARGLSPGALIAPSGALINSCKDTLASLFSIMRNYRLEFAYRTMEEILRYVQVDFALAPVREEWIWRECMDAAIVQKILPKLHGNKKRMEPLLMDLIRFCESGQLHSEAIKYGTDFSSTPRTAALELPKQGTDPVSFRQSYEKLCDMLDAVRRDQYVSFIQ
jgi:5-methylcytosine-specific restriction protein B